jgi:ferrous iron transport protein A
LRSASQLKVGEKATIIDIDNDHPSARRILEVGFTPGEEIELLYKPLFNDPLAFSVRGALIAIRKNEANCILV